MTGNATLRTVVAVVTALGAFAATELQAKQDAPRKTSPWLRFSKDEVARYRVDVAPTAPDSGTDSGFIIAYGYFISPPYRLEVVGERALANGVQIFPPLPLPRRAPDSAILAKLRSESRQRRILRHIDATGSKIANTYWDMLGAGRDSSSVVATIDNLIAVDSLVDSARLSASEIIVYGVPDGEGPDNVERVAWLRPEPTASHGTPPPAEPAEASVELVARALSRDRAVVVTQFGVSVMPDKEYVRHVAELLLDTEFSDRQLWYTLALRRPIHACYSYVANRTASQESWRRALARFEGGEQ
jgi:hypothetical protein